VVPASGHLHDLLAGKGQQREGPPILLYQARDPAKLSITVVAPGAGHAGVGQQHAVLGAERNLDYPLQRLCCGSHERPR